MVALTHQSSRWIHRTAGTRCGIPKQAYPFRRQVAAVRSAGAVQSVSQFHHVELRVRVRSNSDFGDLGCHECLAVVFTRYTVDAGTQFREFAMHIAMATSRVCLSEANDATNEGD